MDTKESNKTKKSLSFKWIGVMALAIIALSSVLFIIGFNSIKARKDFYDHPTEENKVNLLKQPDFQIPYSVSLF